MSEIAQKAQNLRGWGLTLPLLLEEIHFLTRFLSATLPSSAFGT
jgi:hypothetical protein